MGMHAAKSHTGAVTLLLLLLLLLRQKEKKTGMAVPLIYSSNLCIYVSDDHQKWIDGS